MVEGRFVRLLDGIVEACQKRARSYKSFEEGDGAIRICFIPQGDWGADLPDWPTDLSDRYETVARIRPGGNYVLNRSGLDGRCASDSYAISALKVASCLRATEIGIGYRSGYDLDNTSLDPQHGFLQQRGALCYQLSLYGHIAGWIIVSVSGNDEFDDEYVAEAATEVIDNWCKSGPYVDKKLVCSFIAPPPIPFGTNKPPR